MKDLIKILALIIKGLFTTKKGLQITTSIIGISLVYGFASYAYTEHYKNTTLKPFYQKVKLAQQESNKIKLPNLISEKTISQTQGVGRRSSKIADCTKGSYWTASGKSGSGLWCMKGYVKYFGADKLNQNVLDNTDLYMKSLGWKLTQSDEEFNGQQNIILYNQNRGGGFIYTNSDGIDAYVNFAPKNAPWENCYDGSFCNYSHHPAGKSYPAYIEVGIKYEQRPF